MKFRKKLYVQVFENLFQVRDIDELRTIQKSATSPFSHPRMLVGDFTAAEACLKSAISEAMGKNIFLARPWVLIHPKEKIEGGLSQVEERVFLELAQGAGASKVMVWVGHTLADSEVADRLNQKTTQLIRQVGWAGFCAHAFRSHPKPAWARCALPTLLYFTTAHIHSI